jgi:hypothetical protein
MSKMANWSCMETARKMIVEVLPELLEKAQRVSGSGITRVVGSSPTLAAKPMRNSHV